MFCCTLLYVHSSIAIILMGKRELVALLTLSSWCLRMVERLFLAVPWGCLGFVTVVFPDYTHLLFTVLSTLYVMDPSFSKWPPTFDWMGPVTSHLLQSLRTANVIVCILKCM